MRSDHRLAVPRAGIQPISAASSAYISAMITTATVALSSSTWRADLRRASARRECDGERTSCASDVRTTVNSCEK